MATISKRGPYQWQAKVRRKHRPSRSRTFDTKADAETWARQIEAEFDRGVTSVDMSASKMTLREALDRYEREVTPHKKGAQPERYRLDLWRREHFADYLMFEIKGTELAKWRDHTLGQGFSSSKVRNDLNLLSHVYTIASTEWGLEGLVNPVSNIRKPSLPEGRDRRLRGDEEKRLLLACKASRSLWLHPIVIVALETGMRLGEIMSLRWETVDLDRAVAHLPVTKNNLRRNVPLSKRAVNVLSNIERPDPDEHRVFPIMEGAVKSAYKNAVVRAAIEDLRFHDLRHEATSRFFEKDLDMMEVATITGHKTLSMLRRYTHLRAEDLARKLG